MIKVSPAKLKGTINAIPSKSFAHRLLILASLAEGKTTLIGQSTGVDTDATVGVLNALGANITLTNKGYEVIPIKNNDSIPTLNVRESGSTLRFLLPLVAVLGKNCKIIGEGRLGLRPNKELLDALRSGGAKFDGDALPLNVEGSFDGDDIYIKADVSSQFVSGLLMAMQLLPHKSKIHLVGNLKSKNYVDITIQCMNAFGARVSAIKDGFALEGGGYKSPKIYTIEGDWSNSAFWLVAGAINGDLTVNNLNLHSSQGDKAILDILEKAGASVKIANNSINVRKSTLHSFNYDMEDIPDLVPIVAVLAGVAKGESRLSSVERLRFKESDRIQSTLDLLNSIGVVAKYDKDIIIEGNTLVGGFVNGYNDHRIVMSAVIGLTQSHSGGTVSDEHAVNKSYGRFFEDLMTLGGVVNA